MKTYFSILITFLILVSCGHVPETRYFKIHYDMLPAEKGVGDKILLIRKFTSDPIYQGDKLIYKKSDYEVKFDFYRRWITPPAEMLTTAAHSHIMGSGLYQRVTLVPPQFNSFLVLSGHVKQFDEVYSENGREARVALWVELLNFETKQLQWSGLLIGENPINGSGEDAIIQAMSQASNEVLDSLVKKLQELQ